MQYLGGKSRIAERLADTIITYHQPEMPYLEPFMGAGSVTVAMAKRLPSGTPITACDIHEDLILMWQALQIGWEPPNELDETVYKHLKHCKPSALRGFAGFGCAFGGDWFHGYARNTRKDRYAKQSRNSLLKKISYLRSVTFLQADYSTLKPTGSLIYCDPPYSQRAGYRNKFDHTTFWQIMREWSVTNTVLVSEYQAPNDFKPVLTFERNQELRTGGTVRELVTERLFKHQT